MGALGALNRVYLNIGLYSEEWLRHFNPLAGGKPISPIPINVAQANSSYWQATERQTPFMAAFFLKAGRPDRLEDAPGGEAFLTKDEEVLERGKLVFAERCARCHSSKIPAPQPASTRPAAPAPTTFNAGTVLGLDQDRRLQGQDAGDRAGPRLPRRQLPVHRPARAGDPAPDQRLQPARDQRDRGQHLGQLLLADLQGAAVGRHGHRPPPDHRRAAAVPDARRRPRLHPAADAGQPVVDRTLPPEQHAGPVRPEPVGRGPGALLPDRDRAAPVARGGAPRTPSSARRFRA